MHICIYAYVHISLSLYIYIYIYIYIRIHIYTYYYIIYVYLYQHVTLYDLLQKLNRVIQHMFTSAGHTTPGPPTKSCPIKSH